MNKIYNLLKSKKIAIILICCLFTLILIGVLAPQDNDLSKKYNFFVSWIFNIFSSYIFLIISLLFLINLSFCLIDRYLKLKKINLKFISSFIFHLSFYIIIISGLVSKITEEKFKVLLVENISQKIKKLDAPISLIKFNVYKGKFNSISKYEAILKYKNKIYHSYVNKPALINNYEAFLYLYSESVRFNIFFKDKIIFDKYVNLSIENKKKDNFKFKYNDKIYNLYIGKSKNKIFFLKNKEKKYIGNKKTKIEENIYLSIKDRRTWAMLIFQKNKYKYIFFIGILIGVIFLSLNIFIRILKE